MWLAAVAALPVAIACRQEQEVRAEEAHPVAQVATAPTPPPEAVSAVPNAPSRTSDSASKAARAALAQSAAELDSAFARVEHVEGFLHLVNALDAWELQEHARAGKELQAAADNLERGARYVRLTLDAPAVAAATDARAAARRLGQSSDLSDDEFRMVTAELDAHLRMLGATITRKK